ncbi:hypothetical protein EWM57_12530 [Hymenobacter persicinus]|uniref:TonB C-terminal domain-containing protein n=2 Tax=Hymenobacter persicinus TaxID=2025506 RepID=A0A4Q5LAE3_9BACT|nr:hypothetical protein EWM57_12530 [Hymenobacter persicinus]
MRFPTVAGLLLGLLSLPVTAAFAQNPKQAKPVPCLKPGQRVYEYTEQMPQFPGQQAALSRYFAQAFRVPAVGPASGAGPRRVFINFVIAADGHICNAQVQKGTGDALEAEALRVVASMPNWYPGYQNGEAVAVSYTQSFTVPPTPVAAEVPALPADKVSQPPRFIVVKQSNGVELTLENQLRANSAGLPDGHAPITVPVQFVIDTTGLVSQVKPRSGPGITQRIQQRVEETVYRLRWEPARQQGRKVPVTYQAVVTVYPNYAAPITPAKK